MPDGDANLFRVVDLKQYLYCGRILYYHSCLPDVRPVTYKMGAGIDAHEEEQRRAVRRSLVGFDVEQGTRYFDVPVTSLTLGLTAQIDEVIEVKVPKTALIPVDYKLAKQPSYHYKVQLTAYAMMLEEQRGLSVHQGYLYLMPIRKAVKVPINLGLRDAVRRSMEQMHRIARDEIMPPPTEWKQRCAACEFRRFCNDVL